MAKLHIAQEILDIIYPIGSLYMSVNSTDPKNLFGGTWEKMSGGFLYGAANSVGNGNGTGTATAGNNGNTGSTVLTVDQIPSHNHGIQVNIGWGAGGKGNGWGRVDQNNPSTAWQSSIGNNGGGKGHTHTLNNHTHNIPYMAVWIWKRVK